MPDVIKIGDTVTFVEGGRFNGGVSNRPITFTIDVPAGLRGKVKSYDNYTKLSYNLKLNPNDLRGLIDEEYRQFALDEGDSHYIWVFVDAKHIKSTYDKDKNEEFEERWSCSAEMKKKARWHVWIDDDIGERWMDGVIGDTEEEVVSDMIDYILETYDELTEDEIETIKTAPMNARRDFIEEHDYYVVSDEEIMSDEEVRSEDSKQEQKNREFEERWSKQAGMVKLALSLDQIKQSVTNHFRGEIRDFTSDSEEYVVSGKFYSEDTEYVWFVDEETAIEIARDVVRDDLNTLPETFSQSWLLNYVDEDRWADDLYSDIYDMVHENPESYENFIREQPAGEDGKFTDEQIEKGTEAYIEEIKKNGVMEYMQNELGYSGSDLASQMMPYIDINEAVNDAIETAGWAQFLSRYDGYYKETPEGVIYFIENTNVSGSGEQDTMKREESDSDKKNREFEERWSCRAKLKKKANLWSVDIYVSGEYPVMVLINRGRDWSVTDRTEKVKEGEKGWGKVHWANNQTVVGIDRGGVEAFTVLMPNVDLDMHGTRQKKLNEEFEERWSKQVGMIKKATLSFEEVKDELLDYVNDITGIKPSETGDEDNGTFKVGQTFYAWMASEEVAKGYAMESILEDLQEAPETFVRSILLQYLDQQKFFEDEGIAESDLNGDMLHYLLDVHNMEGDELYSAMDPYLAETEFLKYVLESDGWFGYLTDEVDEYKTTPNGVIYYIVSEPLVGLVESKEERREREEKEQKNREFEERWSVSNGLTKKAEEEYFETCNCGGRAIPYYYEDPHGDERPSFGDEPVGELVLRCEDCAEEYEADEEQWLTEEELKQTCRKLPDGKWIPKGKADQDKKNREFEERWSKRASEDKPRKMQSSIEAYLGEYGENGRYVIHPSVRNIGKIQVTHFLPDDTPAGHEEYDTLADALYHVGGDLIDLPWNLKEGTRPPNHYINFVAEAKKMGGSGEYMYISPMRPIVARNDLGQVYNVNDSKTAVIFSTQPLSYDTIENAELVPFTKKSLSKALEDFYIERKDIYGKNERTAII